MTDRAAVQAGSHRAPYLSSRLQEFGITIFAEMSMLADRTGAINLGQGFPELGNISIAELRSVRGKLGLPVERDLSFTADHPMSVYAEAARQADGITEDTSSLLQAAATLAARRRS